MLRVPVLSLSNANITICMRNSSHFFDASDVNRDGDEWLVWVKYFLTHFKHHFWCSHYTQSLFKSEFI